jgi:hypothetical protein
MGRLQVEEPNIHVLSTAEAKKSLEICFVNICILPHKFYSPLGPMNNYGNIQKNFPIL